MHTRPVLQKFFRESLPFLHRARARSLIDAVVAVSLGAQVSITTMGRSLGRSGVRIKHRIKAVDRLVGNGLLWGQRCEIYQSLISRLLTGLCRPMILIDWSEFSADRQQQLLRASLAVGSRAITLYEEVHPQRKLANRRVQHRFLKQLKAMLPADCRPIIIADSGFRGPFYRYVEGLGWHWLGRIRNRDFVQYGGAPNDWIASKKLHAIAGIRAQDLGPARWARTSPLEGRLILIRQPRRGRKHQSLAGVQRRSKASRKHATRQREPWLLIASPSLQELTPRQIVRLYKTRMQIETGFRDTKSTRYGFGIANDRHTAIPRAENLLLITALASFLLWLIGCIAKSRQSWQQLVAVNSSSKRPSYSPIYVAKLITQYVDERLPLCAIDHAPKFVEQYHQWVLFDETDSWG